MSGDATITELEALPEDGTLLFSAAQDGERVEGILLDLGEDVVAFENYCQHWRDVRLDTGDGASMQNGEIVCEKHGAYFETDSGYCNYGPCEGAVLAEIEVSAEAGTVYLTDDRYESPRLGPAENGGAPGDGGTAGGRIDFSGN